MTDVMPWVLSFLLKSLVMSAVILVFIAGSPLFVKLFRARVRYMVWVVALAGLLIPAVSIVRGGFIAVPLPAETHARPLVSENTPDAAADIRQAETAAIPFWRTLSFYTIGFFVWGMAALSILTYQVWRYIRFIRLIRRWGEPVGDEETLSLLRSVQQEEGLARRTFDVRVCAFISSSLLTGFIRPVIVLPQKPFEADELELIFRHELIHYKRRDLYVKLLSVAALSVHWFNPVVYWMYAVMQADGEASCDEAVIKRVGDGNRQFYAELMIKMIGRKNTATMLSTCFYGGKRSVRRRLGAILDTSRKVKKPAYAALTAAAVLTLFSGSVFALTAQDAALPDDTEIQRPANQAAVDLFQAQAAALDYTGEGIVTMCRLERKPREDILIYHIHVASGPWEYCLEIDAGTGDIRGMELRHKP